MKKFWKKRGPDDSAKIIVNAVRLLAFSDLTLMITEIGVVWLH